MSVHSWCVEPRSPIGCWLYLCRDGVIQFIVTFQCVQGEEERTQRSSFGCCLSSTCTCTREMQNARNNATATLTPLSFRAFCYLSKCLVSPLHPPFPEGESTAIFKELARFARNTQCPTRVAGFPRKPTIKMALRCRTWYADLPPLPLHPPTHHHSPASSSHTADVPASDRRVCEGVDAQPSRQRH